MFPNLKAEMARKNITCKDIGSAIEKTSEWMESRLQGKAMLPIDEAIKIRQTFFPYASYEYLFSDTPIVMIQEAETGRGA